MKEIYDSLLNKAIRDYNIARTLYVEFAGEDEIYLNNVGYHLEQAVELAIKYTLEEEGVDYPYTHDIEQLIRIAEENDVDLDIGDFIDQNCGTISTWESSTRYVKDYLATRRRIEDGLTEIKKYLDRTIERDERQQIENVEHEIKNVSEAIRLQNARETISSHSDMEHDTTTAMKENR